MRRETGRPCCTLLCNVISYHVISYHIVLYYIILYYVISYYILAGVSVIAPVCVPGSLRPAPWASPASSLRHRRPRPLDACRLARRKKTREAASAISLPVLDPVSAAEESSRSNAEHIMNFTYVTQDNTLYNMIISRPEGAASFDAVAAKAKRHPRVVRALEGCSGEPGDSQLSDLNPEP